MEERHALIGFGERKLMLCPGFSGLFSLLPHFLCGHIRQHKELIMSTQYAMRRQLLLDVLKLRGISRLIIFI